MELSGSSTGRATDSGSEGLGVRILSGQPIFNRISGCVKRFVYGIFLPESGIIDTPLPSHRNG